MDFYFLLFSLLFPRTVLLIYHFFFPALYPNNTVPEWADILLGVFLPRILILIYIHDNLGIDNLWFVAHLTALILAWFGGRRMRRRRIETRS